MKLVTFQNPDVQARAGWLTEHGVVDMNTVSVGALPVDMLSFIDNHEAFFTLIQENNWLDVAPSYPLDAGPRKIAGSTAQSAQFSRLHRLRDAHAQRVAVVWA